MNISIVKLVTGWDAPLRPLKAHPDEMELLILTCAFSPPPLSVYIHPHKGIGNPLPTDDHGRLNMPNSTHIGGERASGGVTVCDQNHLHSTTCTATTPRRNKVVRTQIPPMLLLRAIPETVMCQLVLSGWQQSSSSNVLSPMF